MPSQPQRKSPKSATVATYNEDRQYRNLLDFQEFLYRGYRALSSRQCAQISIYVDKRFIARAKRSA